MYEKFTVSFKVSKRTKGEIEKVRNNLRKRKKMVLNMPHKNSLLIVIFVQIQQRKNNFLIPFRFSAKILLLFLSRVGEKNLNSIHPGALAFRLENAKIKEIPKILFIVN